MRDGLGRKTREEKGEEREEERDGRGRGQRVRRTEIETDHATAKQRDR